MPAEPRQPPIDPRDRIEREPPNWGFLPIAVAIVVLLFFVLIPFIGLRWFR